MLDLFGGTGSISYEFASRGAERVYCVEMNREHASFIRKESQRLGLGNITAVHSNVFDFLPICREKFDIIFADPHTRWKVCRLFPTRSFHSTYSTRNAT